MNPAKSCLPSSPRLWRTLRQVTQILSFLLFAGLLVYANAQRPVWLWTDLFSRLDPLLMLTASLAGRVLLSGLILAAGTLLFTLVFGRAWCGWLCPLGSLLDWLGPRHLRRKPPSEKWRAGKYLLLAALLLAAVLGNQSLVFLDPITLLNRTFSTAVWPAAGYAVQQGEAFLYRFSALWPALDALHNAVILPVFQAAQAVFGTAFLVALLFVGLVALNWVARRFWCRYLCPLGGFLGLVSRLSLLRREVTGECAGCGRCIRPCPTGTVNPKDTFGSDPAECIDCLDCLVDCQPNAAAFRWHFRRWRPAARQEYDPARRQVLAALGLSAAAVALAGVEPVLKRQPPRMIRPPGATLTDFSARCIRCGACIRVCLTQGLQPSLFEGGVQNFMTPHLVPRLGSCDFGCAACGQVCPSGALPRLTLEEKQSTVIGLASVNRNRCLPWAYNISCIICEESCPLPDKAVQLEEVQVVDSQGETVTLQRPYVVQERCIGCGVCEWKCPLGGDAAIQVYAPTGIVVG